MSGGAQTARKLNYWELAIAGVIVAIGVTLIVTGGQFGTGSFRRIGPGFFPSAAGWLMVFFGICCGLEARYSTARPPAIRPRVLLVCFGALLVFALIVKPLGLVPASFALVFISRFAEPGNPVLGGFILSLMAGLFSWGVFILGLRLPLQPFWW
ncbi:tripartite tricarboxylate transporter TctB family protein [Falsigemmobacter intermedius]|uniref:Tripartite tricarboxylate transporter TctB family protein n=1 Tax=Falsigemmobacter intermedius TaxID=1553448 RepID=A0A3S3UBQ8_9RHOB|nr:tripartite tricarboxylate transporter TctB family protein [Falsigemmobacter intermedius]RWY40976.1 tripartite tricarboxylate transporter TctB family protein [Falsigemmobacter intermedius]